MKHITKISVPAKAVDTTTATTYDTIAAFLKNPVGVTTSYINSLIAKLTPTA